ncbi:hypothetical protein ZWY2020_038135, partial [Hordeum vulgare]
EERGKSGVFVSERARAPLVVRGHGVEQKAPVLSQNRVIGSSARVWGFDTYVKKFQSDKLEPKANKCIFIGYPKQLATPAMACVHICGVCLTRSEPLSTPPALFRSGNGNQAAMFDVEYARWQEEHNRLMYELRAALQQHLPEGELQMYVESCLAHHDEVLAIKDAVIKGDVFHLISGVWRSPAERCFLWLGGFRPSEVIKMVLSHVDPLTEQQIVAVYGLQQSAVQTEEALSQGLDALYQSLSDTVVSDALTCCSTPNVSNYMGQMGLAVHKLSTLEGVVRQAEKLRQQTLHRLHQVLTARQMARSLLAVSDYFHRLRVLSSFWVNRNRMAPSDQQLEAGPHT